MMKVQLQMLTELLGPNTCLLSPCGSNHFVDMEMDGQMDMDNTHVE